MRQTIKNILLFAVSLFSLGNIEAQYYRPFPEGEAIWTIQSVHIVIPPPDPVVDVYGSYIIQFGDTLINGTTYHKIFRYPCYDAALGNPYPFADTGYLGALRQNISLEQVYIFLKGDSIERLLYDFSNDTIGTPFPNTIQKPDTNARLFLIDTTDFIAPNGFSLNYIYKDTSASLGGFIGVAEGLGGSGLISKEGFFIAPGSINDTITDFIYCVSIENNLSYANGISTVTPQDSVCILSSPLGINQLQANMAFGIFPNPAADYTTISTAVGLTAAQLQIFNITGQLIFATKLTAPTMQIPTANFAPGIYFIKLRDTQGQVGVGKLVKE